MNTPEVDVSTQTINEDGSAVLIEAVFYRHFGVYAQECDSIEEAVAFLNSGEDYGELASVGVFVDGQPRITDQYVHDPGRPPTDDEAAAMRADYVKVRR